MRLHVIAVGRRVPPWVAEGCAEYAKRISGDCVLRSHAVAVSRRSGDAAARRREEGQALLGAVPKGALLVALEARGALWDTGQLVTHLADWRDGRRDVAFLIGGPDGLSQHCLEAAALRWSLSPLTLPHALVRVVVIEQLYRAWSILQGHPYHR